MNLQNYENASIFIKRLLHSINPDNYNSLYLHFCKISARRERDSFQKPQEIDWLTGESEFLRDVYKAIYLFNKIACEDDVRLVYICSTIPSPIIINVELIDYICHYEAFLANKGEITPEEYLPPILRKYAQTEPKDVLKTLYIHNNAHKYAFRDINDDIRDNLLSTVMGRSIISISRKIKADEISFETLRSFTRKNFEKVLLLNFPTSHSREELIALWRIFTGGRKEED